MDPNTYLQQAKLIVARQLAGHAVDAYLFGSRAKGEATRYSDIDIALLPKKTMPIALACYVREALEESTIPYQVDVVDLSQVSEKFYKKVLQEGILWYDSTKND